MRTIVWVLALGAAICVGSLGTEATSKVTVFVEVSERAPQGIVHRAELTATAMFAAIGLKTEWRGDKPNCARHPEMCSAPNGEPIRMILRSETAQGSIREEMGFAQPGTGMVTIWYGQIEPLSRTWPGLLPVLLAHVLVHEVTHILQGVPRHSDIGVMKAYWNIDDYREMAKKPLPFTELDTRLILDGLASRKSTVVPVR
jgi:hypothetical protein